jgi:Sigma-70, region 4
MTTELALVSDAHDGEMTPPHRHRARSLGRADAATNAEIVQLRLSADAPYDRPRSRLDCENVPRPCPYVGCRHNLYLDYNKDTGNIRLNFPDLEPDQMPPEGSCSLDVADQGGVTLNAAGEYINLTRERIRQVENTALSRLRAPPVVGRKGSALAESMAALRTYAGHESHSPHSPLGEQMNDGASDAAEKDEPDVRRYRVSLPHILDESVTDEEYSASMHRIWDQWRTDRQALSRGDLHIVREQYVTAGHVKVLEAIRNSCRDRGHPPTVMELADIANVKGATESTRRQNTSAILRSLRELGLLHGRRGQLRVVDEPSRQVKTDGAGERESVPAQVNTSVAAKYRPI